MRWRWRSGGGWCGWRLVAPSHLPSWCAWLSSWRHWLQPTLLTALQATDRMRQRQSLDLLSPRRRVGVARTRPKSEVFPRPARAEIPAPDDSGHARFLLRACKDTPARRARPDAWRYQPFRGAVILTRDGMCSSIFWSL